MKLANRINLYLLRSHFLLFYLGVPVKSRVGWQVTYGEDMINNVQIMNEICILNRRKYWNKRAMMALNRSPESVSPQNEFYLLYYYCSNLWPPGWGQFWPQGYHMNRIDIGPNIIVEGQIIKTLLLLVSEKKNFEIFHLCSYVLNLWLPGRGQFWPHGHHMNNLGTHPLGDVSYQISKLCNF